MICAITGFYLRHITMELQSGCIMNDDLGENIDGMCEPPSFDDMCSDAYSGAEIPIQINC